MKIKILADERSYNIPIPNALLMNKVAFNIIVKALNESGKVNIPKEYLKILLADIKKLKKSLKNVPFVYVKSSSGEEITITL